MATALHPECTCRTTHSQEEMVRDEHCVNHGNRGTCTHLGILRDAFEQTGFHVVIEAHTPRTQYLTVVQPSKFHAGWPVVRFEFDKQGSVKMVKG